MRASEPPVWTILDSLLELWRGSFSLRDSMVSCTATQATASLKLEDLIEDSSNDKQFQDDSRMCYIAYQDG